MTDFLNAVLFLYLTLGLFGGIIVCVEESFVDGIAFFLFWPVIIVVVGFWRAFKLADRWGGS